MKVNFSVFSRPHKAESVNTVSRWIRTVMKESGIDVNRFSAYSTRAASTSAVQKAGLPVDHILSAAGWSSIKTFATFYNKPILEGGQFG